MCSWAELDPSLPLFTPYGSYWTNSTTSLLPDASAPEITPGVRNRCNADGYKSVALIPLRSGGETIGLLQLNDHRPDRFALDQIEFLEGLGASIGIALKRKQAEEDLQASEERFRELADLLPQTVYECDAEGALTFANRQGFKQFGYAEEDLATGLNIRQMIAPEDQASALQHFRATLHGAPSPGAEYTALRKDGTTFPAMNYSSRVMRAGQVLGLRGILVDITERRLAETAQRMAGIGQLAAGVAHDFNNLLASMMMRAELVSLRPTPDAGQELVDTVLRAGRRGADICRNLMSFARPEEPLRAPTYIEAAMEASLSVAARQMEAAGVNIRRDYAPDALRVQLDAGQMEQVFLNLIINSCHAMPQGGTLTVGTRYDPQARPGHRHCGRHRLRHPPREPAPDLRALLHHQGPPGGERYPRVRAGPLRLPRHHHLPRGLHLRAQPAGRRHHLGCRPAPGITCGRGSR